MAWVYSTQSNGGEGKAGSKDLQFRVLFHFNCFSFLGQIKGQVAISYRPQEG